MKALSDEYQPYLDDGIFGDAVTSKQRQSLTIVAAMDDGRISMQGGYPSCVRFYGSLIIVATVDHDGGPELIVQNLNEFLSKNEFWLEELEE